MLCAPGTGQTNRGDALFGIPPVFSMGMDSAAAVSAAAVVAAAITTAAAAAQQDDDQDDPQAAVAAKTVIAETHCRLTSLPLTDLFYAEGAIVVPAGHCFSFG